MYTRLTDKSLADMIEALIGCFLLRSGLSAAFNLLHYFQICPVSWSTLKSDKHYKVEAPWHFFLQPKLYSELNYGNAFNPSSRSLHISKEIILELNQRFFQLQEKLGYGFKKIELLAEAVTHQSSSNRQYWGNYQRYDELHKLQLSLHNLMYSFT
ncbi:unnamed protein product [Schistosoma mattheei]|uniref:RNase III domain-containing protein n=2 Tax=Schistosoma TaxID=6181 RepID=A0A3P8HLI3_9TREM|nr:unnamed protein product [Schistosoma mattheei]